MKKLFAFIKSLFSAMEKARTCCICKSEWVDSDMGYVICDLCFARIGITAKRLRGGVDEP